MEEWELSIVTKKVKVGIHLEELESSKKQESSLIVTEKEKLLGSIFLCVVPCYNQGALSCMLISKERTDLNTQKDIHAGLWLQNEWNSHIVGM